MPASSPPWPALADAPSTGAPLTVHRAVLGKVHQAASDFRWITHPEALRPRKLGLDSLLSFGPEDRPERTPAWRALPDAAVAVAGYRSRAVDRAGRSGGLEKQILYWPNPEPRSLVAGAFALLGALREASDAIWWDHWEDFRWDEPDFFLPRDSEAIEPGRLDLLVAEGLTQLTAACPQDKLASLYAEILASPAGRPAALEGLAEPLPPLAVAALLLPFAPAEARRLSIAAGLPNSRQMPAGLANWSAVVRTVQQPELPTQAPEPSEAQRERGAVMAAAVWRGEPGPSLGERAAQKPALAAPPPAAPAPTPAVVQPNPKPAAPPPEPAPAPPPLQLSPVAERFQRFLAAGSEQRYLEAIPGNAEVLSDATGRHLLRESVEAIENLEPDLQGDDPRARQLQLKVELIRAWMLSCFPRPDVARSLGTAKNKTIPPLLFASDLDPEKWARASSLAPEEFRRLIVACGNLKKGFTRAQLERFNTWARHPALGLTRRG